MWHRVVLAVFLCLTALTSRAEEPARSFRLAVAPEVQASGLTDYLLPRFALKTQRSGVLVSEDPDAVLDAGDHGQPVMARDGRLYRLQLHGDNDAARRFGAWLGSAAGQQTIAAFAPDGGGGFAPAADQRPVAALTFDGDPVQGRKVAETHCARCHRIAPELRGLTLGSTPSFAALRALPDWVERFGAFHVLNPHPAFMQVEGVSPPFDPARPPPIVPVILSLDNIADVQAYAAGIAAADLGAEVENR